MIMHFLVNDSNPNRWSLVQRNIRIIIDESEDDSETNSPFFRLFFTSKNRTQFSIAQKLKHTGTKFTFLSFFKIGNIADFLLFYNQNLDFMREN